MYTMMLSTVSLYFLMLIYAMSVSASSVLPYVRRSLSKGSDCVEVGIGTVAVYYKCTAACDYDEAQQCIYDMRFNTSGNCRTSCNMNSLRESLVNYPCCPTLDSLGILEYSGSNYPELFACFKYVGCDTSTLIYKTYLDECNQVCPVEAGEASNHCESAIVIGSASSLYNSSSSYYIVFALTIASALLSSIL